jgi:hypothetical protein
MVPHNVGLPCANAGSSRGGAAFAKVRKGCAPSLVPARGGFRERKGATLGPAFALPEAMNRWEYKCLRFTMLEFSDVGEARLNASGDEGWEVVAVVGSERHGYSHDVTFVLKRPLR